MRTELGPIPNLCLHLLLCLHLACCSATQPDEEGEWIRLGPASISDAEFESLRERSAAGDGEATYLMYHYIVVGRKVVEGVNPAALLKLAAERGVPQAQCSYYTKLMKSHDMESRNEALYWLRAAVKQGFEPAIELLEIHNETQDQAGHSH